MTNMTYMAKLKIWLLTQERNKSWLAKKCNVSPTAVKYWLELRHQPSAKHRQMRADITGIKE